MDGALAPGPSGAVVPGAVGRDASAATREGDAATPAALLVSALSLRSTVSGGRRVLKRQPDHRANVSAQVSAKPATRGRPSWRHVGVGRRRGW